MAAYALVQSGRWQRGAAQRAARDAVYRWCYARYGLMAAARYLCWSCFVAGELEAAEVGRRIGRRGGTVLRWMLDDRARFDIPELSDLVRGMNLCLTVKLLPQVVPRLDT